MNLPAFLTRFKNVLRLRMPQEHKPVQVPCFEFGPSPTVHKQKWFGHVHTGQVAVLYADSIDDALKHCRKLHPDLTVLAVYCSSLVPEDQIERE